MKERRKDEEGRKEEKRKEDKIKGTKRNLEKVKMVNEKVAARNASTSDILSLPVVL